MDIGINYLDKEFDKVYGVLIENKFINTLKFPGKYCTLEELENCIDICKKYNIKIDIHGLPKMVPAVSSNSFIKDVQWKEISKIIKRYNKVTHISTHIGIENGKKIEDKEYAKKIFKENMQEMKKCFFKYLDDDIEFGVENIPGGFKFDKETLKPEYVSNAWKTADFGVFDIAHAKLAGETLGVSYEDYKNNLLEKNKVKILHVSGNCENCGKYLDKKDKHILTCQSEIKDTIDAIDEFKNLKLVVSEYAYNTRYSYEKEIMIEAILLWTMVNTKDEKKSSKVLEILKLELNDDISNCKEVINKVIDSVS